MSIKQKKRGLGIEMRTLAGRDGRAYLVFRTAKGTYHVFAEVEAKQAARECGASREGTTHQMWNEIWPGVYDILGAQNAVRAFRSAGSTAPAEVAKTLGQWHERLEKSGGV